MSCSGIRVDAIEFEAKGKAPVSRPARTLRKFERQQDSDIARMQGGFYRGHGMTQPLGRAQDDAARYRRVRIAFASVWLVVGVLGNPAGFLIVALFGVPLLLGYVFGIRSLAGSVFAGLAMLAAITGTTLYVIGEAASSTAALGYLYLPLVGVPLVVVALFVDRAVRSPKGSVVAGLALLAVTIFTMVYITDESAAESFCDHANGLGNTMIEVGVSPLTASGAERLVAFHPDFVNDSEALRKDGLTERAHVCRCMGGGPGRPPRCRVAGRTRCGV